MHQPGPAQWQSQDSRASLQASWDPLLSQGSETHTAGPGSPAGSDAGCYPGALSLARRLPTRRLQSPSLPDRVGLSGWGATLPHLSTPQVWSSGPGDTLKAILMLSEAVAALPKMATRCQAWARFGSLEGKPCPEQNPAHPCSLGVPACLGGPPTSCLSVTYLIVFLYRCNTVPCKSHSTTEGLGRCPRCNVWLWAPTLPHLLGGPVEDFPWAPAAAAESLDGGRQEPQI